MTLRPALLLTAVLVAACDSAAPAPPAPTPPPVFPPAETLAAELVDPAMIREVVDAECTPFQDAAPDAALFHIPQSEARRGACAPLLALADPGGQPITAEAWARASGEVTLTCVGAGTRYAFRFDGLVPGGVYTIWHFPGSGGGALATHPGGARNVFTAQTGTTTFTVVGTAGAMTMWGTVPACTLPVPPRAEVGDIGGELFVVVYHTDNRSWGDVPGPDETIAGHLVVMGR
ncbi:hypothetical protein [Rubrivirga sp. IMCC45206]|uniref:hypothetical protein n=1 Tax=Rubrivirga sp. IMCC45206 TaxID=3391614 RepID=UPI00399035AE